MIFKFPKSKITDEVFDSLETHYFRSIFTWIINSKYRTAVNLKGWIQQQVDNPSEKILNTLKDISDSQDYDIQIMYILYWVRNNIIYKSDSLIWKMDDYWQTAEETVTLKTGDCEDGAILLYVLGRLKGIPHNRLLLLAGDVNGGGHCWLGYKPSEMPLNLAFIDWCYWVDLRGINERDIYYIKDNDIHKYNADGTSVNSDYYNIWFGFNEVQSYEKLTYKWSD